MDELVQKLAAGDHPIVTQRYKTVEELKQAIDRGYVLIKFTDTRGGTELGVRLDQQRSDWSKADFAKATGTAHLAGDLTLNYVKVRCVADVDLSVLAGAGRPEIVSPWN
ncbi:MAG: MbtH domain protein [Desulfobacteraceae bacterium]|nr:MAG: MbtH domain protein [Desulfobacteraceae bacterium]